MKIALARALLVRSLGRTGVHSVASRLRTCRQSYEVRVADEDSLTTQRSPGDESGRSTTESRLRATFSWRLNPALAAFPRAEFVAKDVAIEDSTCSRGR